MIWSSNILYLLTDSAFSISIILVFDLSIDFRGASSLSSITLFSISYILDFLVLSIIL